MDKSIFHSEPRSIFDVIKYSQNVEYFTFYRRVCCSGCRSFFVKGGRFPSSHISDNRHLRNKGIVCAVSTDALERKKRSGKRNINF